MMDPLITFVLLAAIVAVSIGGARRSEEHTSELQSQSNLVCRLLLEKKKKKKSKNFVLWNFRRNESVHVTCVRTLFYFFATRRSSAFFFFFFNDTATTEIYTLSLHDALPISRPLAGSLGAWGRGQG